ncbi:MAG: HEAT repeat domain-containing protein [Gemmataceae bacterium]
MQIPLKKLLSLLDAKQPEGVRRAAAVVLGEVGGKDAGLASAIGEALADESPGVRLEAIRAAGKLRVDAALPQLLERIKDGGEEAEAAAHAAAMLGAKGVKGLHGLMPKVAPGLRRYIAAALAAHGAGAADPTDLLRDKDPGVVDATMRSVMAQLPTLTPAKKATLVGELIDVLKDKKAAPSPATEAAAVRLLSTLDDAKAAAVFWDRTAPGKPFELRVMALTALGRWVTSPGKEQLQRLFECAADRDGRVAGPALITLNGLTATDKNLGDWLALLQAPDSAVRRLAVSKLGDRDEPKVAEALMNQFDHSDRALREDALVRLRTLTHGRAVLTQWLFDSDTPDRAWALARAQALVVKEQPKGWADKVFAQAAKYLDAGDRRNEAFFFLLREADANDLRERVEAKAAAFRKKKDYESALRYLRLLTRDPACGFATRFEAAACELKVSPHELGHDVRAAHPGLRTLVNLAQNYEPELMELLDKTKWLDPEDLYYAGFHLAEQIGRAKAVGAHALKLVGQRSPKSKLAQAAKSKLKGEGLD